MGGGGLAYYVPARLLPLSESVSTESTPELEQEIERKKAEVEEARQAFTKVRDSVKQADRGPEHAKKLQQARQAMQKKQAELVALTDPAKRGPVGLGVRDAAKPADTEIRIRVKPRRSAQWCLEDSSVYSIMYRHNRFRLIAAVAMN